MITLEKGRRRAASCRRHDNGRLIYQCRGKTDHGVGGGEGVYRGEWRLFKLLGITEERPGRADRHVESGLSQLRLHTVL